MLITTEMCEELMEEVRQLKQFDYFFRKCFTGHAISVATGIPRGTVQGYLSYNELPASRYRAVKDYVDAKIKEFKKLKGITNEQSISTDRRVSGNTATA